MDKQVVMDMLNETAPTKAKAKAKAKAKVKPAKSELSKAELLEIHDILNQFNKVIERIEKYHI